MSEESDRSKSNIIIEMPPRQTVDDFWVACRQGNFDLCTTLLKEKYQEIKFAVLFKQKFEIFASNLDRLDEQSFGKYPMLLFSVIVERWTLFESLLKSSYHFLDISESRTIVAASLARGISFEHFSLLLNIHKDILHTSTSLLQLAAVRGNLQIVKFLIKSNSDVNNVDHIGKTALHYASFEGNLEIVNCLIDSKANLDIRDQNGRTALHYAAVRYHLDIVKCLINANANLNICDNDGDTALHLSVPFDRGFEISRCLVESGANLDITNSGTTPLHTTCTQGSLQTFKLLIDKKANINLRTHSGQSCLHLSVAFNSLESVEISQILIEKGLDVNAKNKWGSTPLHGVGTNEIMPDRNDPSKRAPNYREQLTLLLLKHGANQYLQDFYGNALHHAASLESIEVVNLFLQRGMNVNEKNKSGETVLSFIFREDSTNSRLIDLLVKNDAKLSIPHESLPTPQLMSLVRTNNNLKEIGCYSIDWEFAIESEEITEAFIRFGFDVNEVNEKGFTPLFYAAAFGSVNVIQLLIERKADVTYQNSIGYSALHFAANYGRLENLKLLVKEFKTMLDFNSIAFATLKPTCMDITYVKRLARVFETKRHNDVLMNRKTLEVLKWLIEERNVPIGVVDEFGRTLLEIACKSDFLEVFEYLIEKNNEFLSNSKVFEFICKSNSTNIFKFITSSKKEIFKIYAKKAVLIASKSGNFPILQFLEKQEKVNWKLVDKNGNNGLHIACTNGHPLEVIELLCRTIDVNARNNLGQTPFMLACKFAQFHLVNRFSQMPLVELDLRDTNNSTAFNWACWGGDIEMVKLLFWSKKVQIESSSFRFAAERGHQHIISFLLSIGLQIDYLTLAKSEKIAEDSKRMEMLKLLKKLEQSMPIRIDATGFLAIGGGEVEFEEKIGQGGFGKVYKGKWKGQTVAIKKLSVKELSEKTMNELKNEANILFQLRGPKVVSLLGVIVQEPLCLVMEFLERGSLHDYLCSTQKIEWKQNSKFVEEIAEGLLHLHSNNVIHRDLKSVNILMDKLYNLKLADFGLASLKEEVAYKTKTLTHAVGSYNWFAPELFEMKAKNTKASDVYAFGMVCFEIITRRIPWQDIQQHQIGIIVSQGKRETEFISKETPAILKNIMESCWNQNPIKRPIISEVLKLFQIDKTENKGNDEITNDKFNNNNDNNDQIPISGNYGIAPTVNLEETKNDFGSWKDDVGTSRTENQKSNGKEEILLSNY